MLVDASPGRVILLERLRWETVLLWLLHVVEEEFGVEIPDDAAEKITTVRDAIDYIEANKA